MKRLLCFLTFVLLLLNLPLIHSEGEDITASTNPTAIAQKFVEQMASGDYRSACSRFDANMLQEVCINGMQSEWESVIEESGKFRKITGTRTMKRGNYDVVFVRCEFENDILDIRVAVSGGGEIHAIFFSPTQSMADYTPAAAIESRVTAGVDERDITIGSGDWPLPATLTLPSGNGPFPAVVMVHGAGPMDRDEQRYANRPFHEFARGMAMRGIASIRYDKGAFAHNIRISLLKDLTVKEEVIDDVTAALTCLRGMPGIDTKRIFVLGHSQGGMLAPRIARQDSDIAGLIMLAAPTRPLEDVILEQTNYLAGSDGSITDAERTQIKLARCQAARAKDKNLSMSAPPIFGAPASYWLDLRDYDPAETASHLPQPMLILHGERDYQVTMDDFEHWKQVLSSKKGVSLRSYSDLNHFFIDGNGKSRLQEYRGQGHFCEGVIDDIANWILRQPGTVVSR